MVKKILVPLVGAAVIIALAIALFSMARQPAPDSEPPATVEAAPEPAVEVAAPEPVVAPAPVIAVVEPPAPWPIPETAIGPARVPAPGVLIVEKVWIHLDDLRPPRENGDCRRFAIVFQCTTVSRGALAEVVAGKHLNCAITRYAGDERNWGTCHEANLSTGVAIADAPTINAQLVLVGWAYADEFHSNALVEAAAQAEANGLGIWNAFMRTSTVATQAISGNAVIRGANILDIREIDVHLLGIDAPEEAQQCSQSGISYPCGVMARAQIIALLAGHRVFCDLRQFEGDDRAWGVCADSDPTGRAAQAGAISVNELMVRSGWAVSVPRAGADFSAAQAAAQQEGLGLWSGDFVYPANWRAGER
jgi:endonuclease YncB( thermonuclease family)